MTRSIIRLRQTLVWAALVLITLISLAGGHDANTPAFTGAVVLLLAFLKAHIVVREFMEVWLARRWLRLVGVFWVACAGLLLVALYVRVG